MTVVVIAVVRAMEGATNSVSLFTYIPTTGVDDVQMFRHFSTLFSFCQEYARNNFIPLYCDTHSHPHIIRRHTCQSVHLCLTLEFVCHIFYFGLLSPTRGTSPPTELLLFPFAHRNTFNECKRHTPHRTITRHSSDYRFS